MSSTGDVIQPAQTGASTWALRCPKGHTTIAPNAEELEQYRCESCCRLWDHGPYDAREWDFPVLPPQERKCLSGTKAEILLKEAIANE